MGKWDSSMIHEYNTLWYTIHVCIIRTIPIMQGILTLECTKNGKNTAIGFQKCTLFMHYVIRWCYRWKNTFFFGLREEHPAWTIIGFCLDAKTKTIGGSLRIFRIRFFYRLCFCKYRIFNSFIYFFCSRLFPKFWWYIMHGRFCQLLNEWLSKVGI